MREDRQRLDKWLWFARFAKMRSAAQRLIEDGHVRVNGRRIEAASHGLKIGDVLTMALPHATLVVRLAALGQRRGPAQEARTLYEILSGETPPGETLAPDEASD